MRLYTWYTQDRVTTEGWEHLGNVWKYDIELGDWGLELKVVTIELQPVFVLVLLCGTCTIHLLSLIVSG